MLLATQPEDRRQEPEGRLGGKAHRLHRVQQQRDLPEAPAKAVRTATESEACAVPDRVLHSVAEAPVLRPRSASKAIPLDAHTHRIAIQLRQ